MERTRYFDILYVRSYGISLALDRGSYDRTGTMQIKKTGRFVTFLKIYCRGAGTTRTRYELKGLPVSL